MRPKLLFTSLSLGLLTTCCTIQSHGQSYKKKRESSPFFGVSLSGGFTMSHTDFAWTASKPSPVFSLGCHYTPVEYADFCIDFQKGVLKGDGNPGGNTSDKTSFRNKFGAFSFIFRFAPLKLAENDPGLVVGLLTNIYFGMGVGLVHSNLDAADIPISAYGASAFYKGSDLFVPFEVGMYIPIIDKGTKTFLLNINLRTNRVFSDDLDGYVPTVAANQHNDAYSTLTIGAVYRFGI